MKVIYLFFLTLFTAPLHAAQPATLHYAKLQLHSPLAVSENYSCYKVTLVTSDDLRNEQYEQAQQQYILMHSAALRMHYFPHKYKSRKERRRK